MGMNGLAPAPALFRYEKRAYPRHTYETTAFAEVANRRISGEAATGFRVLTANVGEGGVLVTTDHPLSVGDVLRLVFTARNADPLELLGRVIWMRKNSVRLLGWYTAGLAFHPAGQSGTKALMERARTATATPAGVPQEEER